MIQSESNHRSDVPAPGVDLDRHRFIWVCGLHRSGTTLLFRNLRSHPRISGFHDTGVAKDEGQLLQTVITNDQHHGGAGIFGFRKRARLTETSPLATEQTRDELLRQWTPYWDLSRDYLLEKSPPTTIRSRFFQALFPNSYFIFITRHPAATAMATLKWKWRRATVNKLIRHWVVCHEMALDDCKHLKRWLWIKYEDLVAAPQRELERVYQLLDLPVQPMDTELRADVNRSYLNAFAKKKRSMLWRYPIARTVRRLEDRVRQFGYSLEDLNWTGDYAFDTAASLDVATGATA